jgi:hypothetical protein
MFRVALALYFFMTTMAGPWLNCCCVQAAKADLKGKLAAKAPPTHEGCACCRVSETTPAKSAPDPAVPSPHQKCRCHTASSTKMMSNGNPLAIARSGAEQWSAMSTSGGTFTVLREVGVVFAQQALPGIDV